METELKAGDSGLDWTADDEPFCGRCGASVQWATCGYCGGDVYVDHDCGEDSCCCLHPEPNVVCDACRGSGGAYHCVSTPEWCRAHPMPGCEDVRSTAMSSAGWADA